MLTAATLSDVVKLLLVAPTVDANDVGEAWVAYQWAHNLSTIHDVTLLTYRKRGAPPIQQQLPDTRVVEWLEPPMPAKAERINSLLKPAYFPFAVRARRWIRQALIRGEHFDIAHQPLPVAMRYPSPLTNFPFPYVVGPVGGSLDSPPGFRSEDTAPWYVNLRRLDSARIRHDPFLRSTFTQANCVLGIAPYVGEFLQSLPIQRIEYVSETGLVSLPPVTKRAISTKDPIRLLYVGRVIRTKGVRDLIRAIPLVNSENVTADVVGDGFDLEACKKLASDLGIADRVTFHGRIPRTDVDKFYTSSHIFAFPSFREPGGNAIFEAMSYSLPLVVCNRGGPAAATDDSCAVRIDANSPTQLAHDLAESITILANDPERRIRMGEAARQRVESIGLWSSKVTWATRLYKEIVQTSGNRM